MRKQFISIGTLLILVLLGGASLYAFSARGSLVQARALLANDPTELSQEDLVAAIDDLEDASTTLSSLPVQILRVVPVARQNLSAARSTVDDAIDVLESALDLKGVFEATLESGVVERGRVDFEAIERITGPLARQEETLRALLQDVEEHRNGWLLPPVWDALNTLLERADPLHRSVERALRAVELAPGMLGGAGGRTYLTLFVNNAELRGAGGILSSVGTLSAADGRISRSKFSYYVGMAAETPEGKVESPPDFERRFARYRADTGLWINATVSADVPEVAEVAAELFRRARGASVDGVVVLDARGLAALVPSETAVAVPGTDRKLSAQELPPFLYSETYEVFADEQPARREALISVGQEIVSAALRRGLDRSALERVGRAVNEGHIRVVSFEDEEDALLRSLGASGELSTDATDSVLVAVQNLGADKLDYWVRRSIDHRCTIGESTTRCRTRVDLRNETPRGLPIYVTQTKRPYGIYRGYLEIYIPGSAEMEAYSLNGEAAETFLEPEDGRLSVGTDIEIKRDRTMTALIHYTIPVGPEDYALEVTPQPLAHDARLEVRLAAPEGWGFEGSESDRSLRHRGELATAFTTRAVPEGGERRSGIPALWDGLKGFLEDPLF
jgi:hypothetical protein